MLIPPISQFRLTFTNSPNSSLYSFTPPHSILSLLFTFARTSLTLLALHTVQIWFTLFILSRNFLIITKNICTYLLYIIVQIFFSTKQRNFTHSIYYSYVFFAYSPSLFLLCVVVRNSMITYLIFTTTACEDLTS